MISPSLWHSIRIKPDVRNWLQYVHSAQNNRKRVSDVCYFYWYSKFWIDYCRFQVSFWHLSNTLFSRLIIFNVICVIIKKKQNCSIQAFLDFRDFDLRNFQFIEVYNSIQFSSPWFMRFLTPRWQCKSRNAISLNFSTWIVFKISNDKIGNDPTNKKCIWCQFWWI